MFGGMLVGWAKPTPVITRNFRKIVRDDNLTTLAGPASNLLIVLVAFIVLAVVSVAVPNGHQLALIAFVGGIVQGVSPSLQALLLLCRLAIASLQRRASLRPDSHVGQLHADDLPGTSHSGRADRSGTAHGALGPGARVVV
jgi:hypothetical protein